MHAMRTVLGVGVGELEEVDALDLETCVLLDVMASDTLVLTPLSAPAPCEAFDRPRTNPGSTLSTLWNAECA